MATAPTFTPAEIAAGQQFFATNPTPDQIYGQASQLGLSPEQVAGLYQQSVGGDYAGLLGGINQYLTSTGQSLPGGYQSSLLGDVTTSPNTNLAVNQPSNVMSSVVSGPISNVVNQSSLPTYNWSDAEVSAATDFFKSNPTPDQIFNTANQIGLNENQLADLFTKSMGGNIDDVLSAIGGYTSSTNQSLTGGYTPGTLQPTIDNIVSDIGGTGGTGVVVDDTGGTGGIIDVGGTGGAGTDERSKLTQLSIDEIVANAQANTPEGGNYFYTLLDFADANGYTDAQMDIILGLPAGLTAKVRADRASMLADASVDTGIDAGADERSKLTELSIDEIIANAQANTPEGGNYLDTLLDFGDSNNYTDEQMDILLGLPAGSTAKYRADRDAILAGTNTGVGPITGLPTDLGAINPTIEQSTYDTSNYFDRYFPVSVTGGRANQTTGLNNVSGQSSLADILANIQGQYTPQQFRHSGGSYGAGRFLPASMAPGMVDQALGAGFTPSQVSAAKEFFTQVTDPQQIFNRANEIGLSSIQLADLFSKATGANYSDVLQSIDDWSAATGQFLKGGYTPGLAPWFEPASFEEYSQSLVNKSLDQAVAETMGGAGGAGGTDGTDGTPSAWSQMTESERQSWVDANPGKYIAGLTAAVALLPGGAYLASRQDPYLGMSLNEYAAGKASNIAMGGLLEPGQGAPVVVSSGNTVSNQAAMDKALQGASDFYG